MKPLMRRVVLYSMVLLCEMGSFGLLDELSLEQLLLRCMQSLVFVLPVSCSFCVQGSLEIHLPVQTLLE